LTNNSYRV